MSRPVYRIPVAAPNAASAGYEIVVGAGVWASVPALIERACLAHRYAVITDHQLAERYGSRLLRALHAAGHRTDIFAFEAGEERKTRQTWAAISDAMLEAELGRDTAVVALGGGVAGDLAGFVAATYMRGVPFVQLPTSLLAMIDACVGGKTGVNAGAGKNLIGSFWPPRLVVIDPELLRTLPAEHLRGGLAEAVKHAAIADVHHLRTIERRADALLGADPESCCELIARSLEIKIEFVGRDFREAGPRKALNFGHTVAHALEALSAYRLLHGDAVAIGMVIEARIGERIGVTEAGTADALRGVLARLGLPTAVPHELPVDGLLDVVRTDKKARGGRAEYTLLTRLGAVDTANDRWTHAVPADIVREALTSTR